MENVKSYNNGNSITKDYITELKYTNNKGLTSLVESNITNNNILIFILKNLGHLPVSFDYNWIIPLLKHKNETIRLWAVKNIGKLASLSNIELLSQIIDNDDSSMVKREAVSSIGRMRTEDAISFLIKAVTTKVTLGSLPNIQM